MCRQSIDVRQRHRDELQCHSQLLKQHQQQQQQHKQLIIPPAAALLHNEQ